MIRFPPPFVYAMSFFLEETGTDQTNPTFWGLQNWFWRGCFMVRFPPPKSHDTFCPPPFANSQRNRLQRCLGQRYHYSFSANSQEISPQKRKFRDPWSDRSHPDRRSGSLDLNWPHHDQADLPPTPPLPDQPDHPCPIIPVSLTFFSSQEIREKLKGNN